MLRKGYSYREGNVGLLIGFRKYPYLSQGRLMEISRGAGVSKAQFLKESMMLNWNFWRVGWGGGGF